MAKYAQLRASVASLQGLMLVEPRAASIQALSLAHDPGYVLRVLDGHLSPAEVREIGFPWSEAMVERARRSVGASIDAAKAALTDGVAVNLAGGTHHAGRAMGSGFCVFNDIAVATRVLQADGDVQRVLVVDLDVHQGNGTAQIFAGDARVFTLSLHGEKNFPFRKQVSTLDVGLRDGTEDRAYLEALSAAFKQVDAEFHAEFVFYVAGADVHENDRLGRLKLTRAGMAARDQMVFEFARKQRAPIAVTMAGGYGRDLAVTVALHTQTVEAALRAACAVSPGQAPSVTQQGAVGAS